VAIVWRTHLSIMSTLISEAVMCMALALYHEARDQEVPAQIAVGNVIMNRVDHPNFPSEVCDVVYHGGEVNKYGCQFTFYCDGKSDKMTNKQAKLRAIALSLLIVNGMLTDLTKGAVFYHADYVTPAWSSSLVKTTNIGNHKFYKDK
jgi:spore germination cell wall hydrolase CwlJ-like protein